MANLANNWYWGSANATQTPLPVTFIDFTGEAFNGQTRLKWSTASESNNDYFTISHSIDGEIFAPIGKVNGQGTTNVEHEYSMIDFALVEGRNYYRLSQTDMDGKSATLKTIAVEVDKVNSTNKIYPNPIQKNETLNVEMTGFFPNQAVGVELVNMQGITLHQYIVQANDSGNLSVAYTPTDIASGLYIIRVGNMRARIVVK